MQRILHTLTILAFFTFFGNVSVYGEEYAFDYQKIVETDQPIDLNLVMANGRATIVGGDDQRLIVEAVKRVRATSYDEAQEVADHIEIRVDVSGEQIEIKTNYLKLGNRNRGFWNKLLGVGHDSYGDVDFKITLPEIRSLAVTSLAAEIELSSIEGEIDVENSIGSTKGEFLFGSITVSQPSGDIDLQWIEGDVRIKSTSSSITIRQVMGAIDLSTSTGDVTIQTELDSPKDYFVETTTGRIQFSVPEMASGVLDIETRSGDVVTEVPIAVQSRTHTRLVGEFGRGGPRIKLCSSSGDVEVKEF